MKYSKINKVCVVVCSMIIGAIHAQNTQKTTIQYAVGLVKQTASKLPTRETIINQGKSFVSALSLKPHTIQEAIIQSNSKAVKSFLDAISNETMSEDDKQELLQLAEDICYVRRYALCGLFKSPQDLGVMFGYVMAMAMGLTTCRMLNEYICRTYGAPVNRASNDYMQQKRAAHTSDSQWGNDEGNHQPDSNYQQPLISSPKKSFVDKQHTVLTRIADISLKGIGIVGILCCIPKICKAWRLEYAHAKLKEAREIKALVQKWEIKV